MNAEETSELTKISRDRITRRDIAYVFEEIVKEAGKGSTQCIVYVPYFNATLIQNELESLGYKISENRKIERLYSFKISWK